MSRGREARSRITYSDALLGQGHLGQLSLFLGIGPKRVGPSSRPSRSTTYLKVERGTRKVGARGLPKVFHRLSEITKSVSA